MRLSQTQQASDVLRQTIVRYNRLMYAQKELEANCLLPIIKQACEELSMDYQVLLGIKINYFATTNNPEKLAESNTTKCPYCDYITQNGEKGLQAHVGMKHKNLKIK